MRAKGLAAEIKQQEAGPGRAPGGRLVADRNPGPDEAVHRRAPTRASTRRRPASTTSCSCCVDELNAKANKKYKGYKLAVVGSEFDFEAPTDYDNDPSTGLLGGEIQGRLTMRDVILVRKGGAVKVKNPQSGHYTNLLHAEHLRHRRAGDPRLGLGRRDGDGRQGQEEGARRSSTSSTPISRRSTTRPSVPSIRAQQAQRAARRAGREAAKTLLLGDFNSNVPPRASRATSRPTRRCSTAASRERSTQTIRSAAASTTCSPPPNRSTTRSTT